MNMKMFECMWRLVVGSVIAVCLMVCLAGCEDDDSSKSKRVGWTFKNQSSYTVNVRYAFFQNPPEGMIKSFTFESGDRKFVEKIGDNATTIYFDYAPKDKVHDVSGSNTLIQFEDR